MVLPVPKPPGTAAVPPLAMGNMVSMTRWPVMSGWEMGRRVLVGRGVRMGHFWHIFTSWVAPRSSLTVMSTSSTRWGPLSAAVRTVPLRWGGTITRCSMREVSGQVAMIWPGETSSPGLARTVTSHSRSGSREGISTPEPMKAPSCSSIFPRGRCTPS